MRNTANRRKENTIVFLSRVEKVIDCILRYTDNIDKYPKRVRFSVSNPFLADALSLLELGNEFYDILVECESDCIERRALQRKFISRTKRLEFWLRLSENRGYLTAREVSLVARPLSDAKKIVAHMYHKDKERYSKLLA